jgi:ankyrin repeat protein
MIHIIGLGVKRDIDIGLSWIVTAAEAGCVKARATVRRLFSVYGRKLEKDDDQVRTWLLDGVRHGSELALDDLLTTYPESEECRQANDAIRFTFNLQWPGSLEYHKDVHANFNLFDTAALRQTMHQPNGKRLLNTVFLSPSRCAKSRNGKVGNYSYGTLLHIACCLGLSEAVEILIEAGLDLNKCNSSRRLRTPLHCALRHGHHQIAFSLIRKGANCRPDSYWEHEDITCPDHIYYLVYLADEGAASEMAELFVANGAEVNVMRPVKVLDPSDLWPLSDGCSITPLRWAIMHGKAQLVRKLVELGARFPTSKCWPSDGKANQWNGKLCLHLQTPCTSLEILRLFFEQLKLYELPLEFSQTPLGLIVSEDDTPERLLRLGFGDEKTVIAAMDLLLNLQPGYEDQVLWSLVRHNHLALLQHLLCDKGWDLETRWMGLTMLHTAILYGHVDIVSFLLSQGASATLVTSERKLTCFHLLAMVPRDQETDNLIINMLIPIAHENINATETRDGVTSLHLAVRNKKLHLIRVLLRLGADPLITVRDQVNLLAEGRSGILKESNNRMQKLTDDVTILGEVLLQCNQDKFYPLEYAEQLLYLFLANENCDQRHLYVDTARTMTIFHVMAMLPFPNAHQTFSFVASRLKTNNMNILDSNRDTPLHYACISYQTQNVGALLDLGCDPRAKNLFGFTSTDLAIITSIILGPPICGFQQAATGSTSTIEEHDRIRNVLRESVSMKSTTSFPRRKDRPRETGKADGLRRTIALCEERGVQVHHPLKQLAMAWGSLAEGGEDQFHQLVPMKVVGGEQTKVPEASVAGLNLETNDVRGVVHTEKEFIMHQADRAEFMICEYQDDRARKKKHISLRESYF